MNMEECKKYLEEHLHLVGLHGWKICMPKKYKDIEDGLASIDCDINEQILKIDLDKTFKTLILEKKQSTLIHELIHARVNITELKKEAMIESVYSRIEEDMVNDIERGFMYLLNKGKK